jgi:phage portal protein BeeE
MPTLLQNLGSQLVKIGQRIYGRAMSVVRGVFTLSATEVFDNIDSEKAVQKGFNANICVYVVVKMDAVKFGSIPRYVYTNQERETKASKHKLLETKAFTPLPKNDLTKLLERPNPYQSQDFFFTIVRAFYKVCGEAFIWCNRGDIERYRLPDGTFDDMVINKLPVLEMYVLPSFMISIIPDEMNPWGIGGYILETTNRPVMRRDDVIHWRDINLNWNDASRDHLRGMTPLTPGSKTLEESNSLSKASMRMAQNEGSKAVIFDKSMKAMSPTQQTNLKNVIDAKINNNEVAGSVAAVQGDWGMLDLAMTSKDMEMIEKKKMSWHEMALLFDIPPELVVTDAKYDNAGNAMLQWVYKMIPALKQLDGEMNRVLLPAFNLTNKAFIASDVSELPEVRKQMLEEAKIMQELWAIPPNDVLEHLGFDRNPDKAFDEPWPASGRQPWSEQKANAEMERELERLSMQGGSGGGY